MKLSKERISFISKELVNKLIERKYVEPLIPKEQFVSRFEHIITDELMLEDKINQEVKELLKVYEKEIDKGDIDYSKMFNMIKNKLIKERGVVL
ncbi:MAG: hypothetical protein A2Z50_07140 [Nitrospirae bacterium RBG_19FT_COMBO_42_15]|nr:MAG: hypothetical protein A2Z50_07140 [Nitrospirae bacterium RBG_19FT_COMBO_42_15]